MGGADAHSQTGSAVHFERVRSTLRHGVRWPAVAVVVLALAVVAGPLGARPTLASELVSGVDVSHWNGAPNWRQAQASGVRFVIAKATDGRDFVDQTYARNKAEAEALGIAFTAYHFARPDSTPHDARAEADHFVATANLNGDDLIPALDLERSGGLSPPALRRWVRTWLAEVQVKLGVKPMIYSSPSFWNVHMGNSTWFAENGYLLWIAHWGVDTPRVPAQQWLGHGWTMWQTTSAAQVEGFPGRVDHDFYSARSLRALRICNNTLNAG